MKNSPYSPDAFMTGLYEKMRAEPYRNVRTAEEALEAGRVIREKARILFDADKLTVEELHPEKVGKALEYPEYTLQKYSVEICDGLKTAVFVLTPKNIKAPCAGVVALCGHGYGVRQILGISKGGRKKRIRYFDNYQKNFAAQLAKRGCVVAAPELFGFGEARLKKDLKKPFYISSCDELSHHLLPYGLTVASLRVFQARVCAKILLENENVDADRLGCMGISGGGLTALYASVIDESFKKTVISGYVNTFYDSILSRWHCPDNYIPDILTVGEICDFAASLAPRELLIESGTRDKLFPIEASEKAHAHIKKIYELAGAKDKLTIDVFNGKHRVSGRISFKFFT